MIGRILGRIIWIIIAYLICSFAAGMAFVLTIAGASGALTLDFGEIAGTAFVVSTVISMLAFVPAVVAIVIAEIFSFRNWIYYVAAGAISSFIAIGGAGLFDRSLDQASESDTGFVTLFLVPGVVAGLVYWLAAGRDAGKAFRAIPDSVE
ncbi:MAG: hypothetical protein K8F25_13120 [Fimbriimonadaceae bacterium]|nr:hypothetical protein [Alphaproteobacteria bacterium]